MYQIKKHHNKQVTGGGHLFAEAAFDDEAFPNIWLLEV